MIQSNALIAAGNRIRSGRMAGIFGVCCSERIGGVIGAAGLRSVLEWKVYWE